MSTVTLEFRRGREGHRTYGRRTEEFLADFQLVSQRELEGFEQVIFRYHFLLGADWKLCCRMLQMDRGAFFHIIYRIEQKLGRIFAELEPYALFPVDEYFGGTIDKEYIHIAVQESQKALISPRRRLRVPLAIPA